MPKVHTSNFTGMPYSHLNNSTISGTHSNLTTVLVHAIKRALWCATNLLIDNLSDSTQREYLEE